MAISDSFEAAADALPMGWHHVELEISADDESAERVQTVLARHGLPAHRTPRAVSLTITPAHVATLAPLLRQLDVQAPRSSCRVRALSYAAESAEAAEKALQASLKRLAGDAPHRAQTPVSDRGDGSWSVVFA